MKIGDATDKYFEIYCHLLKPILVGPKKHPLHKTPSHWQKIAVQCETLITPTNLPKYCSQFLNERRGVDVCAALFPFLVLPNLYQQFCQVTSSGDVLSRDVLSGDVLSGDVLSGDVLSRQNVSSWLYRQAGTFCPDKMSPLGYIGKRGRFVRTKCPMTKRPRLAI